MKITPHQVYLLSEPAINWPEMVRYFREQGGIAWLERMSEGYFDAGEVIAAEEWDILAANFRHYGSSMGGAEMISEFAGRRCYRSFDTGLNPNVTRVRTSSADWFNNTLSSAHGSVFEHGMITFGFEGISRVLTHELVRHRVGTAISQESMRFVRLTDIPVWMPDWALEDKELMERNAGVIEVLENHQRYLAQHFGLEVDCDLCEGTGWEPGHHNQGTGTVRYQRPHTPDEPGACPKCEGTGRVATTTDFPTKKFVTSFMRRFAPEGVATGMVWSANIRTLRFVIQKRTEEAAEEEIRSLFNEVAMIVVDRYPLAFGDFTQNKKGEWIPQYAKV